MAVPGGGVSDDAARHGSKGSGANRTGARDSTTGAGLFGLALKWIKLRSRPPRKACPTGPAKSVERKSRGQATGPDKSRLRYVVRGLEEGGSSMSALKWLLMLVGAAVFGSAGVLVAYDIYLSEQLRRLLSRNKTDESGADLKARVERSRTRNPFSLRVNILGGSAGQGLR